MLFTHATASRIKSFIQCEFKYFLEYVIQYPPMKADNIYSGKGSAVHEALEGWTNAKLGVSKDSGRLVEEDWRETLRKYYAKSKLWELDNRRPDRGGFPHPVTKTCESCPWATKDNRCEIADMGIDAVNGCPRPNFEDDIALVTKTLTRKDYNPLALDENGNFKRKILGVEIPFSIELDGVPVNGLMDLVAEDEEDSSTIEIIDYKTGKALSYDKAFNDAQVRIYAAVARKMWPQYKYVMVTLFYLKSSPVYVPLSEEDDERTVQSLKRRADEIIKNENPSRVKPSKWGFPCDWCIGYDNCGKIKDKFSVDGRFKLPVISCNFANRDEPCHGTIYPLSKQNVNIDNIDTMIYSCKGHCEVNNGGQYISEADSDSSCGQDDCDSEEV